MAILEIKYVRILNKGSDSQGTLRVQALDTDAYYCLCSRIKITDNREFWLWAEV